ncbi:MAG TPA: 2-oxoacid:acceptor oxidoreductase family protein [Candidatus Bathyarchaeia archaeon]
MSDRRFVQGSGTNVFNGNELIVKGALESAVGLIAGYPGSPVAEVFTIIEENADILREHGLWGEMTNDESQGAAALNGALDVGVNAVAVMKSVGLNVAADPINIINYADKYGLSGKRGGAVVVCGDDPHASSTQVAGDSRQLMEHLKMPIIEPSNPQEIKDWIGEALRLSLHSNLVVGYLITTFLAEGGGNVQLYENKPPEISFKSPITIDTSRVDIKRKVSIPPNTWDLEKEIIKERFPRVHEYVRQRGLNKLLYTDGKNHRIGFVASGISYSYLEQALWELGCDEQFPILKLAVTYPLEPEVVGKLGQMVENIVVVEEKSPVIENQVKTILRDFYQEGRISSQPKVFGKMFDGSEGFPEEGGLNPSIVIERVGNLILKIGNPAARIDVKGIHRELDLLAEVKAYGLPVPPRTPGFCAGCPHRETLSTVRKLRDQPAHKDIFAHGDIGCYSMSFLPPFGEMFNLTAMALGGAAGSGMDPFVTNKQYALMGDSTFFWRGMTAISNSIKEGQDILYIILDNKNTAMTGHQPTPATGRNIMGDQTVPQDIEGIVKAMGRPRPHSGWDKLRHLWDGGEIYVKRMRPSNREKYLKELDKVFEKTGVKVVIADKECGITFHRRKRAERNKILEKEGFIKREVFVNISQEVCENCRECTKNTGCPGLTITNTDYGEKIGIDMSTCVSDTYCTKIMACPSFEKVIVTRKRPPKPRVKQTPLDNIPAPSPRSFDNVWNMFISGVGGMGVGLLSSVLARAGTREGYEVRFDDKKGLAIRNGAVSAHVIYSKGRAKISTIVPNGKADLLLGVDMLEAERSLVYAGRARTTVVVNTTQVPTIPMSAGMMTYPPDVEENIKKHTNSDDYFGGLIGDISELYFGSKLYSNVILLGAAFQKGLIPVSEQNLVDSLMETVSRSQRGKNMEAFRLGRKMAVEPEFLDFKNLVADERIIALFGSTEDYRTLLDRKAKTLENSYWMWWKGKKVAAEYRRMVEDAVARMRLDDETNRHLARRVYDLIMWDDLSYARRYVERVLEVFAQDRTGQGYAATKAVILNLHKVMAIKDEIYTTHLLTDEEKLERDRIRYNVNEENGDRISYEHINEPEFDIIGRTIRFNLPSWLAHNWLYNLFKHQKWVRGLLQRWGWHQKERTFRDWYHEEVVGFFLRMARENYDLALRGLRIINDPYRPNEFAVTGFREVIWPKMERVVKQFEELKAPGLQLPVMPVIASKPEA